MNHHLAPVSVTLGLQQNASSATAFNAGTYSFGFGTNFTTDNDFVAFEASAGMYGGNGCAEFDFPQMASLSSQFLSVRDAGEVACLEKSIRKAHVVATLDTGDDYEYGNNAFSRQVTVQIKGFDNPDGLGTPLFTASKSLEITQTQPEVLWHEDVKAHYPNLMRVDAEVTAFGPSGNQVVDADLRLRVCIREEWAYGATYLPASSVPIPTLNAVNGAANPVTLSWNASCGEVPAYELQVVRLYNDRVSYAASADKASAEVDWEQALRYETAPGQTSVQLTMAEGTGYYLWRVRPLGTLYEGGSGNSRNWGLWSAHAGAADGERVDFNGGTLPNHAFFYQQFDADKNWQLSRKYT
ncbi:MAG: hypothetical protein AAF570_27940, partial [Bacteroidota bacterium]